MCAALEKQAGGDTETTTLNHGQKDVEVLQGW